MKDLYYPLAPTTGIAPVAADADVNGVSVDLQGYEAALLVAEVGIAGVALSGTDKIEFEVEHADDDGAGAPDTWADCADADLVNAVTGTSDGTFGVVDTDTTDEETTFQTSYIGGKRWVRVVANFSGTHAAATPISAVVVRGHGRHQNV